AGFLVPTLVATALPVLLLAYRQDGGAAAMLAAVAGSVEKTAQLTINTLSFVRVGAFAIAHAGLSAALVLLIEAAGGGGAGLLVLVLGNVFVIALEALVVSVQTTRLVLFEFFTRFFVGSGRAFHPAAPPALAPTEVRHDV
ncbi:MAG TPA: hypothetical protein VFH22_11380, partial [Rhodocyclaceae bacterium]|nr:hypothetical protein [Rhodocyclaceae bacterium]